MKTSKQESNWLTNFSLFLILFIALFYSQGCAKKDGAASSIAGISEEIPVPRLVPNTPPVDIDDASLPPGEPTANNPADSQSSPPRGRQITTNMVLTPGS